MQITIITGDDEQAALSKKEELLKTSTTKHVSVDCSEDAELLFNSISMQSLFAPQTFIWATNFEALTEKQLQFLNESADSSNAILVARSNIINPKVKSLLKNKATFLNLTTLKGKSANIRVATLLKESGLNFDNLSKRMLNERVGHDLDRLVSIIKQCKILGLQNPSFSQVEILVGTSAAPGVPWALSDAIEKGDVKKALENCVDVSLIPTIAYLTNRYTQVALLLENVGEDKENIISKMNPYQAEKLVKVSQKLNLEDVKNILTSLAAFDVQAKISKNAPAEFDLLVMEITLKFQ